MKGADLKQLEKLIAEWVIDKGIYDAKDYYTQALKCNEEIGEATGDILKGRDPRMEIGDVFVTLVCQATLFDIQLTAAPNTMFMPYSEAETYETKHLLGYMVLDIAMLMNDIACGTADSEYAHINLHSAYMLLDVLCGRVGTTLTECAQLAYNKISGRSGKMVDGVFVNVA